jgi:hypothetical protein
MYTSDRKTIDFGNGWLKYIESGLPVVAPAAIAPVFDAIKFRDCDVFEYLSGSSTAIDNGSQWITGLDAIDFAPTDVVRVGDVPKSAGKARYALHQLAAIVQPVNQTLQLLCSVPDPDKEGQPIRRSLLGLHHLKRNDTRFTLEITDVDVRAEGYGAVFLALSDGLAPRDKINVALDIGTQTSIISAFNPRGKEIGTIRHVNYSGGCQSLYQRIANHSAIVKAFDGPVRNEDIEGAIKASPYSPQLDGFQFEAIYRTVKKAWLASLLQSAKTAIGDFYPSVGKVVVFGGGANLVAADLEPIKKFVILDDAQTANVRGLDRLPVVKPSALATT